MTRFKVFNKEVNVYIKVHFQFCKMSRHTLLQQEPAQQLFEVHS